jgi:hypothetical protein
MDEDFDIKEDDETENGESGLDDLSEDQNDEDEDDDFYGEDEE